MNLVIENNTMVPAEYDLADGLLTTDTCARRPVRMHFANAQIRRLNISVIWFCR